MRLTESVMTIAKQMADDMLSFYNGDQPGGTPGLLPDPYYWWEAGAMMGALIEYWYYTKDDSYVDLTKQALLYQVGDDDDYMPNNQTLTEGNDDQGFWGLAVMSAAEYNFPSPEPDQPQWLALAQAVFNTQAARWDNENCAGGLRWQIFSWNRGFDYKNSISNACFFALGARLAVFTGNQTYADWAERTWDWMVGVGFIDDHHYVYDGAHIPTNCTNIVPYQFSYNAGGMILGAAAMYNLTESQEWKDRLDNLLEGSRVFFAGPEDNIMEEVACEPVNLCNVDQQSFKAYLSRWFAAITKWAPHTYDFVMPYLRASAVAAASQCVGGSNGRMCGLKWSSGEYDGSTGVGQQMAAMEVALSVMVRDRGPTLRADTGGTSEGDPSAGGSDEGRTNSPTMELKAITTADTAGAAILTAVVILGLVFGVVWMALDETSNQGVSQKLKGLFKPSTLGNDAEAAPGTTVLAGQRRQGGQRPAGKDGLVVDEKPPSTPENSRTAQTSVAAVGEDSSHDGTVQRRLSRGATRRPHNPPLRSKN
ncbi:hypothetical protein S40288_00812 [Stachybotrys chartarum IBT 40288]|nr:hypothetical protein S40288_00812 [Stachybotrys chartarum IBT 40288]